MRHLTFTVCFIAGIAAAGCNASKKTTTSSLKQNKKGSATYAHLFYKGDQPMLDESTYRLDSISTDPTYGFEISNPVMVGGDSDNKVLNERRFLNALLGPNGESVTYSRTGSCCIFDSPNGFMGGGLLDRYEVKIEGINTPFYIYINMYDQGALKAPKGFTFKK